MNRGTNGITVPGRVLTNPPDEAIVTAVVVLKSATTISLAAEISSRPTGERISAIDRLVVIAGCGVAITGSGVVVLGHLLLAWCDHLKYWAV
jgi:hypothetical protein